MDEDIWFIYLMYYWMWITDEPFLDLDDIMVMYEGEFVDEGHWPVEEAVEEVPPPEAPEVELGPEEEAMMEGMINRIAARVAKRLLEKKRK